MNAQVAAYEATCVAIARKIHSRTRAIRVGAEMDDLVQEGRIHVWKALVQGVAPSIEMIELAMWAWVRELGRQTGQWDAHGKKREPAAEFVPYDPDTLMPLDAARVLGDD